MRIVLGVSGGIAAYKTPELVRRLQDIRADVRVILTPNAARFVSPLSLAAVSNHGVISDQWGDAGHGGVDHIELARWAELLLIAPATANVIAKLAAGIADDALTTYALAHRAQVLLAPAMNTFMLAHPTVRENMETLRNRGVGIIEPVDGLLACGEEGAGKMPDVPVLVDIVKSQFASRDLTGKRVLVTAGPTREPLDPVRYVSNHSSGKMGTAIAAAAWRRGADVLLVAGPLQVPVPAGVNAVHVETTQQMADAVASQLPAADVLVMAAAPADFRAAQVAGQKIKRTGDALSIAMAPNPDILASTRERRRAGSVAVGFALETNDGLANARRKLEAKSLDLIVLNDATEPGAGFAVDTNRVTLVTRDGDEALPLMSKHAVADVLLDRIELLLRTSC